MSETDVLAHAFAGFAEQAGREVISPGTTAVRRTVRRRRARRSVVTALALVLALTGGLAAWPRIAGRPAPAATHPSPALETSREHAVNALPHLSFVLASDSAIVTTPHYTNPARDFSSVASGTVRMYFLCTGAGSITVDVNLPGFGGNTEYSCAGDGSWTIDPWDIETTGGYLFVEITASQSCVGRCSFAYEFGYDETAGN